MKRKASFPKAKPAKKAKVVIVPRPAFRAGYQTVPRSRGVYSRGEMKYFDTERSVTSIPASVDWTATEFPPNVGTPNTLCVPVISSAINQRIGREIKVYKIKIRGILDCPNQAVQATADATANVRLLLVQDKQTNATQAQGEDIMAGTTTASAFQTCQSFQSLANFGKFNVLKDKTIIFQNPSMAGEVAAVNLVQQGLAKHFKFTINYKIPVQVHFNAVNGGTISDIVDNSWCLYATSSSTSLAPRIMYNARVCYKE